MLDKQDEPITQEVSLKGFVRVVVVDRETGEVTQDTGFVQNKITDKGFQNMIAYNIINSATTAASRPNYLGLGKLGVISSTLTDFAFTGTAIGMISSSNKVAVTRFYSTAADCAYVRLAGSWSGATFVDTASTSGGSFGRIGAFQSTSLGGTNVALCIASFAQVTFQSSQDVWATYELRFSQ